MKKLITVALGLCLLLLISATSVAQRGGRGGGRGGGMGGARPGGGMPAVGGTVHSYGGGVSPRPYQPVAGPGNVQAGRASGSYTTQRGSTIDYRGAGAGGTTPGGVSGGRAVGGIQVTTPGGREVTKVGHAGGATGPGGRTVAGREGATVGSGPRGSMASRYQGGVAIGPRGGVAGGSRAGVAAGPGGAVAGATRGTAAAGHYGAAAGRTSAAARQGTVYRSSAVMTNQGVYVRRSVSTYPCFRPGWYRQHPGAWFAAGWAAGTAWRAATWDACYTYCGMTAESAPYNYGSNVVYQEDGVYFNGERAYSPEEYAEQAVTLADTGAEAKVSREDEWMPLGVFAMVQGEEQTSNHIFQLSVNKAGVIRGNYYDAVTDSTSTVAGSIDKNTQRAAWKVEGRKTPTYEAGIFNLTKPQTTMMVHYGKDRSAQFTLIRLEEPARED